MENNPRSVAVSDSFKKYATRAILSIVLFLFVYLIFATFSIALSLFCLWAALQIIINAPAFMTILIALAIASFGLLISIFLFKFIFSSKKVDRSGLVEIDIDTQPELKAMILDIVNNVQTHFPKRIYFSNEINASVFYDSTFWSMFFPVKKNLQIGLGLINTVSQEELKAILAHEFGHFSQRSMKVGVYVYNVNHIIYNILYENTSYAKLISAWSGIHAIVSLMVWIVIQIVNFMQWVLKSIYGLINKAHSALSREMEFHADEVAASVTGSQPLADALLRLNLSDYALRGVLGFYQEQIIHNRKSANVYPEHLWVMNLYAAKDKLPYKKDLPLVTTEFLDRFNQSKLVVKNQWASHPATEDRVARLKALNYPNSSPMPRLANEMIRELPQFQNTFSDSFFENVKYELSPEAMPLDAFKTSFEKEYKDDAFDDQYNGYYDAKPFTVIDLEQAKLSDLKTLPQLFSNEMVNHIFVLQALKSDAESLTLIADKKYGIKSFDYDGQKFRRKDCMELKNRLDKEAEAIEAILQQNDEAIFRYFLETERRSEKPPVLEEMYRSFFDFEINFAAQKEVTTELSADLEFIGYSMQPEQIMQSFAGIRRKEDAFKANLQDLLNQPVLQQHVSKSNQKILDDYLPERLVYFDGAAYDNNNLNKLFDAIAVYNHLLDRSYFLNKKAILDYQVSLENKVHRAYKFY